MKKFLTLLTGFLTLCMLLTACGGPGRSSFTGGSAPMEQAAYKMAPTTAASYAVNSSADFDDYTAETMAEGAYEESGGGSAPTPSNIKLIRNIDLRIKTEEDNVSAITNALSARAESYGGYAASKSIDVSENSTSGFLNVRIPEAKADAFLSDLQSDGYNVVYISDNSEDVTLRYTDTAARIQVLETEQKNYMRYLEDAENVEETMTVERELREVTSELESLRAQMRTLNNQIDFTTITINIFYNSYAVPTTGDRWKETFQRAGESLQEGVMNVIDMFCEYLIPFLGTILMAVIGIRFGLFFLRLFKIVDKKSKVPFFKKKSKNQDAAPAAPAASAAPDHTDRPADPKA